MKKSPGLINPDRLRKIPRHFSWLDHSLIHNGHLKSVSSEACSLYLFLVCVSDPQGLSYYSDSAIRKRLSLSGISAARQELESADLIAYSSPFYQVLSLSVKTQSAELPVKTSVPAEVYAYLESLK